MESPTFTLEVFMLRTRRLPSRKRTRRVHPVVVRESASGSCPCAEISALEPEAAADYVDANEKVYRLATTYDIPDEVGQM